MMRPHLIASLFVASTALASGQRGLELTPAAIADFQSPAPSWVTGESDLVYVGSTKEWHLFLRVTTSAPPGGMPWDHLDTYRVPATALTIRGGWEAALGVYVEASACPVARPVAGSAATMEVSGAEYCPTRPPEKPRKLQKK